MTQLKTDAMITVDLGGENLTGVGILDRLSNGPNKKPDSLLLARNRIDTRGIEMILRSAEISWVHYLDLYDNQVGDKGALAVIQSSKSNNISSVNLSRNRISSDGIVALAEALPRSKVVSLDLRFNPGSESPRALEALVSAAGKHKILQHLQIDYAHCKSKLLPVLRNNRKYVSQTKKELKHVIASIKDLDELQYPVDFLDLNTLRKCEQFFHNKMLVFGVDDGADKVTLVKIQNYINDNFFKITGVVHKGLSSATRTQSASLEVLPLEVVSNITKYCKISDLLIQ